MTSGVSGNVESKLASSLARGPDALSGCAIGVL